ncbi:MAG: hypothetical protein KDD33_04585 [Bdellovibrionales bacterium]|nr:hypothetical protein [Bdellovibrionales bacterium]
MNLKSFALGLISILLVAAPTYAKSKKKEAADAAALQMTAPQVLETKDSLIGVRTALGDLNDGGPGVGLHLERQVSDFVSLNGEIYYSTFNRGFENFGEFKYTSTIFVGYASLHADVLKIRNLDTSVNLGVAHNRVSAKWSSPTNFPNPGSAVANATDLVLFLNARYFFNSQWAGSFSVGKNLNTVLIGADYLF